jgi:probable rRNA maturation factor
LGAISFFTEDVSFQPGQKIILKKWLKQLCLSQHFVSGDIQFIFCSDAYLLKLNQQYLQHNTYTDIITFDYSADKTVSGDIFISIERVKENAKKLKLEFTEELYRVMAHGVLHLMGFKDKDPKAKKIMTAAEDKALSLLAEFMKK